MKEEIIRTVVFFVLITVIVLSMFGSWRVITMDIQENKGTTNAFIPESKVGAGYVSLNIKDSEGNEENE